MPQTPTLTAQKSGTFALCCAVGVVPPSSLLALLKIADAQSMAGRVKTTFTGRKRQPGSPKG